MSDLLDDIEKLDPALAGSVRDEAAIEHLDYTPDCTIRFRRIKVDPFGGREVNGPIVSACGQPATTCLVCVECGHESNVCPLHYEAVYANPILECGKCKTQGAPEVLLRVEPLGGA